MNLRRRPAFRRLLTVAGPAANLGVLLAGCAPAANTVAGTALQPGFWLGL
ncbi:MAG TPA: hypothetical protein VG674_09620 [Amycolatopsis sp.]|nr:hypothetical protein [Amycolatopsis sp.]